VLPTVLPPAEGLPQAERLLTAEQLPPAGKLHRQTLMAANVCTTSSGRLFVIDRYSKQRYLVDTGSDLCVFPRKLLPGGRERTDYSLLRCKWDHHPNLWMGLKEPEPGTTPRLHMAFRDSGRRPTHHRGGPAFPVWSPRRLQEQPPTQRGHITVHVRSHRNTISPQCEIIAGGTPPDSLLEEFPG